MCGGEVVEVESVARRIKAPDINFFTAQVLFDTGIVGTALMNMTAPRRWFGIEMHGCGVSVVADTEGVGQLYLADGTEREFDTRQVAGSDEFYVFGGFQAKDREFIDAIQNGGQPSSHFGDAVKTIELAETILAQALLLHE